MREAISPLGSHFRLTRFEYPNPATGKVRKPDPALGVLPEKSHHLNFGRERKYSELSGCRIQSHYVGAQIICRPDVSGLFVNHDPVGAEIWCRWLKERHLFGLVINPPEPVSHYV